MSEKTDIEINKPGKILLIAASVFILLFAIYYVVLSSAAPGNKINHINSEYGYKKPEKGGLNDSIFTDSAFVALNRQKAFYLARIAMASSDSVALSLNLPDSTATLEINGVNVYTTKILSSRISKVFRKADEYAVTMLLSRPFTITKDYSSIPKEPVVFKVAPKDTTEYKPDAPPDTSKIEYVNFILETQEGIRLYVYQYTEGNFLASLNQFLFDLADRVRTSAGILKCMVKFKTPEYKPWIKIKVPVKDARLIYRALPRNGQFAVFR